jgi:ribosomal protein L29
MNCEQVRSELASLVYADLPEGVGTAVRGHMQNCESCRSEFDALARVREALGACAAPDMHVDLAQVYAGAAGRLARRAALWRRTALGLAAAASIVIACGALAQFELRAGAGQLVITWGDPPAALQEPPLVPAAVEVPADVESRVPTESPEAQEDLWLLRELVRAMAAEIDLRDRRQHEALARLRTQLSQMEKQATHRFTSNQRDIAALYAAEFELASRDE